MGCATTPPESSVLTIGNTLSGTIAEAENHMKVGNTPVGASLLAKNAKTPRLFRTPT
jgi:hypothetical protein